MKKFFKVIGKAGKVYLILDLAALAVIGLGCVIEKWDGKFKNGSYTNNIANVIEDTKLRFKHYWFKKEIESWYR